jgi:hypothetical protein
MIKDIFITAVNNELVTRVNLLKPTSTPLWGKMDVAQMLAHSNITYEMAFEDIHSKPRGIMKWVLKTFIKSTVVGLKPYSKNSRTAPQFIVTDKKDFEIEKQRLLSYINKVYTLGKLAFEGKESHSFGPLTSSEWNIMFYKHLDHHLSQFGV